MAVGFNFLEADFGAQECRALLTRELYPQFLLIVLLPIFPKKCKSAPNSHLRGIIRHFLGSIVVALDFY